MRRRGADLGAKASDPDAAMHTLTLLLAVRERSVHEIHERLEEKGFEELASASAIDRALSCGLLDDERFAQHLIKGRIASGWGKRRIDQELRRFGIDQDEIEGYPEAFFSEHTQLEHALELLKRHRSRSKNPRQAAYRYLMSRGFSTDIASAVLKAQESCDIE